MGSESINLIREDRTWMFLVFLFVLLLVGWVRTVFPAQFRLIWKMLSLKNYAENFFVLDTKKSRAFGLTLQVVALLTGALLIFLWIKDSFLPELHPANQYGILVLGLAIFSLLKTGIGAFLGWLIEMPHVFERFQLLKHLHYHLISILLIPPVAFAAYGYPHQETWLIISTVFAGVLALIATGRAAWQMHNELRAYYSYVFLYFCALEIAPVVLIAKPLLNGL